MNVQKHFAQLCRKLEQHPLSAIRVQYLRRIAGVRTSDPRIAKLARLACTEEPLRSLLANRNPEGWWYGTYRSDIYRKYRGSSWCLLFAAEFGAPPGHSELRASCRCFLDTAYSTRLDDFTLNGNADGVIPCFSAHSCYFLTYFGFGDDHRVRATWHKLAARLGPDNGMTCRVMDPLLNPTCVMVLPKLLKAATLLTPGQRKKLLGTAVERATAKLMAVDLDRYQPVEAAAWGKETYGRPVSELRQLKKTYPKSGEMQRKPSWMRFQFPLHYDADLIEVLLVLARLGVRRNEVIARGVERLVAAGSGSGWKARRSLNGKLWADVPFQDDWVTLRALEILKKYG